MENESTPTVAKDAGPFFHGTKAALKVGDLVKPGHDSNFGERRMANFVYLTATLDAATWGAELGVGDGAAQPVSRAGQGLWVVRSKGEEEQALSQRGE